jgi:hypothetical protein
VPPAGPSNWALPRCSCGIGLEVSAFVLGGSTTVDTTGWSVNNMIAGTGVVILGLGTRAPMPTKT